MKKYTSKWLENSKYIIFFACKLLNSTPQFLSSINCAGIDLDFQISPRKETREDSSQVSVQARELGLQVREQSGGQDNFLTAVETLHSCCNVAEHHRDEVTHGGAY
jgi:hypothetical protein